MSTSKVSSTVACAIAAARATDAVRIWLERLTDEELKETRRKLAERQEWLALEVLAQAEQAQKTDKLPLYTIQSGK